jgi:hypothetical protein
MHPNRIRLTYPNNLQYHTASPTELPYTTYRPHPFFPPTSLPTPPWLSRFADFSSPLASPAASRLGLPCACMPILITSSRPTSFQHSTFSQPELAGAQSSASSSAPPILVTFKLIVDHSRFYATCYIALCLPSSVLLGRPDRSVQKRTGCSLQLEHMPMPYVHHNGSALREVGMVGEMMSA